MSSAIASAPTHAPAVRERAAADHTDRDREAGRPRMWALLEALAYAGAYIDPTGVLAAQRFAQMREMERHRGRR
jgi:hypothetical protein